MRILLLIMLVWCSSVCANGVYKEPADFIAETFHGVTPEPKLLWITAELQPVVKDILGHDLASLRLRYWGEAGRSVWVLEEIGKEKPITVGLVVNNDRLERVNVLAFRESRGWEVRHDFFTQQFTGAALTDEQKLDRHIDGITGATLSARALTKLARLALYLHQHSEYQRDTP